MSNLIYDATPTGGKFMRSSAFGRVIAGPIGSGKTTTCIMELLRRTMQQAPAADGIRYSRHAVIRQTLQQLKATVLKDCEAWLQGIGVWKVSESTMHLKFQDVNSEWVFLPLEDSQDQARLLSMQLTGAFLSEVIEMDISVLGPISGRIGRYPSGPRGNATWAGIIADTNMPVEMSPWHQFFTDGLPNNWQFFPQPSGMAPDAENLNFLRQTDATIKLPFNHPDRLAAGRRYYENLVEQYGEESDWVKRYVYAEFGDDPSGMAVFKQSFRPSFHIVPETLLVPGYPILIGQDFGRNPWSVICQVDHKGRLVVHEEVKAENIGLEKHVQERLKPRLYSDKYSGFRFIVIGDPAGVARSTIGEETSFDALKRLGLPAFPAPTNDIDPRLRAVEGLLGRQTDGGPTLMISAAGAPFLCRAMSGGYRFAKTKAGALKATPDKADREGFSHVADALQYVCLVVHGNLLGTISTYLIPRTRKPRPKFSSLAWT